MEINGKVAIVTGASGGIGRAAAKLLAERGAKVVAAARSAEKLESLVAELPDALAVPTDVTDEDAIRRLFEGAVEKYGTVDILVNNAGQGMGGPIERVDPDIYRSVFELNVVAPILAMQAAIPLMRGRGGSIVNVSSGVSKMVLPGVGAYASTKVALNAISLTARKELEPDGIVVSLVHPWITQTDFFANVAQSGHAAGGRQMEGDTAEYAAGLIIEAIETGEAEIYAESVRKAIS